MVFGTYRELFTAIATSPAFSAARPATRWPARQIQTHRMARLTHPTTNSAVRGVS
jgi:hypothetical protein